MNIFKNVVSNIDRGRLGQNEGLSMGFNRLTEFMPNIQKGTFYLLGGATKSGKTTLSDNMFIYNPFDHIRDNNLDIDLDIDLFSFEVDKNNKILRGITRKLYLEYNIITDVNYVLSKGRNRVSQEIYDKVIELRKYFEELESNLQIHDIPDNPTRIYNYLKAKAQSYGKETFSKKIYVRPDKSEYIKETFDKFEPYSSNKYHLAIIDHIGLTEAERGLTTKETIDKLSTYLVELRNTYNIIPVVVQQLAFNNPNTNNPGMQKRRPEPIPEDFSDSKYVMRNCNIALGLYNPLHNGTQMYKGYNIDIWKDHFRNLEIIRNRDGEDSVNIGLFYNGKSGVFTEMPKFDDITGLQQQELILQSL